MEIKKVDTTGTVGSSCGPKPQEKQSDYITIPIQGNKPADTGDYPGLVISKETPRKTYGVSDEEAAEAYEALFGSDDDMFVDFESGSGTVSSGQESKLFSRSEQSSQGHTQESPVKAERAKSKRQLSERELRQGRHYKAFKDYLTDNKVSLTYLDRKEYQDFVILVDKYISGDIDKKTFDDERLNFGKAKSKKETAKIVPKDTNELTEEQSRLLEISFELLGMVDSGIIETTAKGLPDENTVQEFLADCAKEDFAKKQEEITKAGLDELPETLDEESVKKYVKATNKFSLIEINYARHIVEERLSLIPENEKAQILKSLEIAQKNIEIQSQRIILDYIQTIKQKSKERYEGTIKDDTVKGDDVKTKQDKGEKKKEKLERKENFLQRILSAIKRKLKEFCNRDKGEHSKHHQHTPEEEINRLLSMKARTERALSRTESRLRLTEYRINEANTERQYRLSKIDSSLQLWGATNSLFVS